MVRGRVALALVASVSAVILSGAAGCGSSTEAPSEAQLEAAKQEGEEAARERGKLNSLQRQVRRLKREVKRGKGSTSSAQTTEAASSAESATSTSTVLRAFHAPSGNVSCQILSDGALCSVSSIAMTFAFRDGQAAYTESGTVLSRGSGELEPFGTTISAGSITCTIPLESEPHGITCVDNDSGHGFEASRVSGRQQTY